MNIIMCATENMISDFRGYTCRLLLHDHPLTLVPSSAVQIQAASLTAWLAAWLWEM